MKDYFGYKEKICVVTGAASGMGKGICETLVDMGATVYGLDLVEGDSPGVIYIQMDLSSRASIDEAFTKLPERLFAFFGAAGVAGQPGFTKTFHINFTSNKYMLDTCLFERMEQGGAIAFISSMAGQNWELYTEEYAQIADAKGWEETAKRLAMAARDDLTGSQGYQLSKRALIYYVMKNVPRYNEKGIRLNILMPGSTRSAMTDQMIKTGAATREELIKSTGLAKRFAEAREMAEPIVFLNSNMASYLNGNILTGDYGELAMIRTGQLEDRYRFTVLQ